ncbi:MAG: 50S ribosomal protein L6 [Candidatus Uhrbacteria bacterium]
MSRIGLKPIIVPAGVEVVVDDRNVTVKGSKGSLSVVFPGCVKMNREGDEIKLTVTHPGQKDEKALWGTFRALLQNMIVGVTVGFKKAMEINGIGYRVNISGNKLVLDLGYSHSIDFILPAGVSATVEKSILTLSSIDKQLVGETAARIRRLRPPEPYKGTGIKYVDEIIRRKAGKTGKAAA